MSATESESTSESTSESDAEPFTLPAEYVVQPGDTLPSIARKLFGHESNWVALERANRKVEGYDGFPASLERPGVSLTTDLSL